MFPSTTEQEKFINDVLHQCKFFRHIQIWPLPNKLDYEGWLENFNDTTERFLAAKILSFFTYFSEPVLNKLLYDSVGMACSIFLKGEIINDINDYKTQIYYSYIQGETPNITDSGSIFLRMARDILHISQDNLLSFDQLKNKMYNNKNLNIILLDDFIGSGNQCIKSLTDPNLGNIYTLSQKQHHTIVYAPIIANKNGIETIKQKCPSISLTPAYILTEEYNLFNTACPCWNNDEELYSKGIEMISRISKEKGIPEAFPDAGDELDVRGFCNQGLAIGFAHGIPDASLGFFFYNENGWKPLMKRTYKRIS